MGSLGNRFLRTIFSLTLGATYFGIILRYLTGPTANLKMYKSGAIVQFPEVGNTVTPDTFSRLKVNSYERHERMLFKKYFRGASNILELGGSIGVMTAEIITAFPAASLIVIEGNENVTKLLRRVISDLGSESKVVLISKYLAPEDCLLREIGASISLSTHLDSGA